ncbi:MAG: adenine deaminase, partial [Bacteroidetes bacterium CG_4_10_14_3_um_filter_42_6]
MSKNNRYSLSGQIIDLHNQKIFPGTVHVEDGKIKNIVPEKVAGDQYILPGLIDAHIHIESSMLIPSE